MTVDSHQQVCPEWRACRTEHSRLTPNPSSDFTREAENSSREVASEAHLRAPA